VSFVSNGLFYKKQTERAFVAEKAMQAKSDSTLHHSIFLVQCLQSAGGGFDILRFAFKTSSIRRRRIRLWRIQALGGGDTTAAPYSLGHLST
jgi:hypothetical protein